MSDEFQETSKIADESGFVGQDGINLIATVVGKMRHLWTPTSGQSDSPFSLSLVTSSPAVLQLMALRRTSNIFCRRPPGLARHPNCE
jgi:hypothetical protein